MDKSRFINYIQNPGEVTVKPDIELFQEILSAYPYFQSAHLLKILGSHQTNSIFYEQTLKESALFAADREILMHLVNHPYLLTTKKQSAIKPETNQELEQLNQIMESTAQPLANEQLLHDIQNQQQEEETAAPEETNPNPDKEAETTESPSQDTEYSETDESSNNSFEDWLSKLKKPAKPYDAEKWESRKGRPNQSEQEIKGKGEHQLTKAKDENLTKQEILDRFLNSEPRLRRPHAKFYDPNEKARESIQEDEDLVSEPLAQIHWQQGHYKKAIKIYEKLSLLYPDKFDYFASKITELQSEERKSK